MLYFFYVVRSQNIFLLHKQQPKLKIKRTWKKPIEMVRVCWLAIVCMPFRLASKLAPLHIVCVCVYARNNDDDGAHTIQYKPQAIWA